MQDTGARYGDDGLRFGAYQRRNSEVKSRRGALKFTGNLGSFVSTLFENRSGEKKKQKKNNFCFFFGPPPPSGFFFGGGVHSHGVNLYISRR